MRILDYPSFDLLHTLDAHTSSCTSLAVSPTGTYLAVGGADALTTLWSLQDLLCVRTFAATTGAIKSVSFSFDGAYLVAGSDDGGVGVLPEVAHVETGEYVYSMPATGPNEKANGCVQVAWGPKSYVLAFSGEGPTALRIVGGFGGSV